VLLDVSPSMYEYLPALRRQINGRFADAKYREESNCVLFSDASLLGGNLRKLRELIEQESCDGIYWFSDFQDPREFRAITELRAILLGCHVKLYIRSTECNPSDLIQLAKETGGGYKQGSPSSLE